MSYIELVRSHPRLNRNLCEHWEGVKGGVVSDMAMSRLLLQGERLVIMKETIDNYDKVFLRFHLIEFEINNNKYLFISFRMKDEVKDCVPKIR